MVSFSMQQGYMVLAPAGVCVGIGVFNFGALVQLVRMPPCHGGGHGFESHTHRKKESRKRGSLFCGVYGTRMDLFLVC